MTDVQAENGPLLRSGAPDRVPPPATTTDGPAGDGEAAGGDRPAEPERAVPSPVRRGPRPALFVVAGVTVLAVLAVVAWQFAARGQSLAPGALGGGGPDSRTYDKPYVHGVEYEFAPDRSFDLFFSIRNPGPLPVRVEGLESLGLPLERLAVITPEQLASSCCDPSAALPFQPTDLPADEELVLFATFGWSEGSPAPQSDAPCSRIWWSVVRVRQTVLGLTRTVEVELPQALILRAPGCTG